MKRRDVLAMGGVLASTFAVRRVFAQPAVTATRAAVVIGVDKAENLPILSAVGGAKKVADFLKSEDFAVTLLVDETSPVNVGNVFNAVDAFVLPGTLDMLVIYFAGHGFLNGPGNEWWMLSGAPRNAADAVSVTESATFAKLSGIPNVVFISDACRVPPGDPILSGVRGSPIFPNTLAARATDVDKFFAALPGSPALEVSVEEGKQRQGIFTESFLAAFQAPEADMVLALPDGRKVVPNEKLKKYLQRDVARRAQQINLTLRQIPDAEITSEDDVFIGRVAAVPDPPPPPDPQPLVVANLQDVVNMSLADTSVGFRVNRLPTKAERVVMSYSRAIGFEAQVEEVLTAKTPQSFDAETGVSVNGAAFRDAFSDRRAQAGIVSPGGSDRPGLVAVELNPGERAATVAVQFDNGNGGVVAALPGYIANMIVTDGVVSSVSYVPSRSSFRWGEYESERERLDRLHAIVATAAGLGGFRIEGNREARSREAEKLADDIRVLKSVDPTLGIYAAYAYFDAGLVEKVRSVASYMRGDLGVDIFDVALLAGGGRDPVDLESPEIAPICPMLTQGWELLLPLKANTADKLLPVRGELQPGLWTTLSAAGMDRLRAMLTSNN